VEEERKNYNARAEFVLSSCYCSAIFIARKGEEQSQ